MPVHRRSSQNLKDDSQQRHRQYQQQQKHGQYHKEEEETNEEVKANEEEEEEEGKDFDQILVSSGDDDEDDVDDDDEYVYLNLQDFRREVACPICLGIIRKTRTVMECLHRFCKECIDKSMRMGKNECPACRTHCASRRSLRDDPNYDAVIAALFPDIDKYEAEEVAFNEEERTRNKNIQESIEQIIQRQTDALGRKPNATSVTKKRGRKRKNEATNILAFEENVDGTGGSDSNGGGRGSSSNDEEYTDAKQKRCRRLVGRSSSQPPSAPVNTNAGGNENNSLETNKENLYRAPAGLPRTSEMLTWAIAKTRSNRFAKETVENSGNTGSNIQFKEDKKDKV